MSETLVKDMSFAASFTSLSSSRFSLRKRLISLRAPDCSSALNSSIKLAVLLAHIFVSSIEDL